MQGVKFGEYHSYEDFGLILTKKTIGTPTPKTQIIEVPGADGEIDLTEYLGEVKYSNRPLNFEFEIIKKQTDFVSLFSRIQNCLHGLRKPIILDIDNEFYYIGRITVNEWQSNKNIGKIVIDVDAEPYKYKLNKTVFSVVIGESKQATINLRNLKKAVTPEITISAETTIKYNYDIASGVYQNSDALSASTWTLPELLLTEGDNIITLEAEKGTVITFTYQEGEL